MKLDIDLEELDAIDDPEIRNILKRFSIDGFAVFHNGNANRKIARASAPLRKQNIIITSRDRKADLNVLSINSNIFNAEKLVSDSWKNIIRELK